MLTINGKEVDVKSVVPLKVRDWRELEGHDITLGKLNAESVETYARFVRYCAGKANPQVTHEDVDELTINELVEAANMFLEGSQAEGGTGENFTST